MGSNSPRGRCDDHARDHFHTPISQWCHCSTGDSDGISACGDGGGLSKRGRSSMVFFNTTRRLRPAEVSKYTLVGPGFASGEAPENANRGGCHVHTWYSSACVLLRPVRPSMGVSPVRFLKRPRRHKERPRCREVRAGQLRGSHKNHSVSQAALPESRV